MPFDSFVYPDLSVSCLSVVSVTPGAIVPPSNLLMVVLQSCGVGVVISKLRDHDRTSEINLHHHHAYPYIIASSPHSRSSLMENSRLITKGQTIACMIRGVSSFLAPPKRGDKVRYVP
jgi:hypothetical protein